MSDFKDWCEKVMPFVIASSNGGVVQASCDNGHTWFDMDECEMSDPALQFDFGDYDYRIKPRTIKIGDFDVPEPMRVEPESDVFVYCATPHLECAVTGFHWTGNDSEKLLLRRGMVHASTESAKIHAGAIISLTAAE